MKMKNFTFATIIKTLEMSQFKMFDFPDINNGYDMFIETVIGLKENMSMNLDTILSRFFLGILYYIFKILSSISTLFGIGVVHMFLIPIAVYFIYAKCIRPYNSIQDLDFPTNEKKRKDLNNLTRRLKKIGKKLPPPFPNGWYCLVESMDLNVGEIQQVDCLGEHFAVFRTMDGKAHVTNAHCPHLGANLAVGGTVTDNCIECPFHKWRFNSVSGKCVSIPNIDPVPNGLQIKVWNSSEIDGGIHVWFHAEGEPPLWHIPVVEKIERGYWVYHARNEFLISSHVQEIPENGADIPHLSAVHGSNVMSGKFLPTTDFWDFLGFHEWNGKWETTSIPHEASLTLTHELKFFGKYTLIKLDVIAKQVGPGYVQLILTHKFGSFSILQTLTPMEPLLQKVVHRLYAPWYFRPIANILMWAETVMFYRDVMIWNSKEFLYNPLLVKTDRCIKGFRTWFQQFYSANSLSFKESLLGSNREVLDW